MLLPSREVLVHDGERVLAGGPRRVAALVSVEEIELERRSAEHSLEDAVVVNRCCDVKDVAALPVRFVEVEFGLAEQA